MPPIPAAAAIPAYPYIFSKGLSISATGAKLVCFFRALADSFRFRDWIFSFFMEIGLDVWNWEGYVYLEELTINHHILAIEIFFMPNLLVFIASVYLCNLCWRGKSRPKGLISPGLGPNGPANVRRLRSPVASKRTDLDGDEILSVLLAAPILSLSSIPSAPMRFIDDASSMNISSWRCLNHDYQILTLLPRPPSTDFTYVRTNLIWKLDLVMKIASFESCLNHTKSYMERMTTSDLFCPFKNGSEQKFSRQLGFLIFPHAKTTETRPRLHNMKGWNSGLCGKKTLHTHKQPANRASQKERGIRSSKIRGKKDQRSIQQPVWPERRPHVYLETLLSSRRRRRRTSTWACNSLKRNRFGLIFCLRNESQSSEWVNERERG